MKEPEDQAARFLASVPRHYDAALGPRLFAAYAADLAERLAVLRPSRVLELAAGTGIVTRAVLDRLAGISEIVATDLNPPMLEVARSKFLRGEPVRLEPADATSLPFAGAGFDAVVCQFGVMFFPDRPRSYREVRRVLRRGGSYLFSVWDSWEGNPFARVVHEVGVTFFPEDPPRFYEVPFSCHDIERIRCDLSEAGFVDVAVENVPFRSPIGSAEEFAAGLVHGNPLEEEVVRRGGDPAAVRAAVARAIERELGTELDLSAFVIHARRD